MAKDEGFVMDLIWSTLPKLPDEDHVTFEEAALEEIYDSGFVDEKLYTVADWISAFEPHKTPEKTYVLTKEDFLEKDKYRYAGEIMVPFEPLMINEGKYTDEGLQELIDMSIDPSCSKTGAELAEFFDTFKEKYRGKDDLIRVDMQAKRDIAQLIYDNPSPTRRRELLFDVMFRQQVEEIRRGTAPVLKATPEQAAEVQASTFTSIPSEAQKATGKLKSVEKSKKKGATGTEDEGVELKKVKKSRKGFRG